MTQNLQIRKMNHQDMSAWDNYVDNHQDGTFFHLTGWYHVIKSVFKHKPQYLLAEQDGQIVGVLPFSNRKAIFLGTLSSRHLSAYMGEF